MPDTAAMGMEVTVSRLVLRPVLIPEDHRRNLLEPDIRRYRLASTPVDPF